MENNNNCDMFEIEILQNSKVSVHSEPDILNLFHTHKQIICELLHKRTLLKECKQELHETTLKLHKKHNELDKEKSLTNNLQMQLNAALSFMKRFEEQQSIISKTCTSQMQLDLALKENAILLEKFRNSQHENLDLHRKIEEIESKNSYESIDKRNVLEQISHIRNTLSHQKVNIENIEVKQKRLSSAVDNSLEQLAQSNIVAEYHVSENTKLNDLLNKTQKELVTIQLTNKNGEENALHKPFNMEEWERLIKEMHKFLKEEHETVVELTNSLELAMQDRQCLLKLEDEYQTEIKELYKKLANLNSKPTNVNVETQTS